MGGKMATSPPVRWSRAHPQPEHPTEALLLLLICCCCKFEPRPPRDRRRAALLDGIEVRHAWQEAPLNPNPNANPNPNPAPTPTPTPALTTTLEAKNLRPSSSSLLLLRLLSSSPLSSSSALFGTCAKLSSLPLLPLLPLLLSAFFFPLPSSHLLVSSSPLFLPPSYSSLPLVFFPRLLLFSSSHQERKEKRARRQVRGLGRSLRSQTPSTVSRSERTTPRK